jgi:beta-galactosidase
MKVCNTILSLVVFLFSVVLNAQNHGGRMTTDFNTNWNFKLGDYPNAVEPNFDTADWRKLQLPHDWSIEGEFSSKHPTKAAQAALPAGIGWYRKTFSIPLQWKNKVITIEFGGVFKNSQVWINGHWLGKRPNGYISFGYELSKYLNFGKQHNVIAVKVDNDAQPNSRWYTGSGIYRNVQLVVQNKVHVAQWGTYVTTPVVTKEKASVRLETSLNNTFPTTKTVKLVTTILDATNRKLSQVATIEKIAPQSSIQKVHHLEVNQPKLWGVNSPYLYKVLTQVYEKSKLMDHYETPLGIRYFNFDAAKGFSLNGVPTKILGVCLHHDNGALGAVENTHAIRRKLMLLKEMGANAIRMAHNPPSTELLQLCDQMGFIVQDEAFDVWKKKKVANDYHKDWEEWHRKDLEDFIKRDRNHPSVMMWSIGNEIREQFDSTGIAITQELAQIVKSLDTTRPVTSALTENVPSKNFIYQSKALDLLGFNYKHADYFDFPNRFKGQKIIASESVSAIATRGQYDQPSDVMKVWPTAYNLPFDGNLQLRHTIKPLLIGEQPTRQLGKRSKSKILCPVYLFGLVSIIWANPILIPIRLAVLILVSLTWQVCLKMCTICTKVSGPPDLFCIFFLIGIGNKVKK